MSNNPQSQFAVDNQTPASRLHQLAADLTLTLDVTTLDLSRLPPHVKCTLISHAAKFSVPQLQTSGNIDAPSAKEFSAPQLQTSGYIDASSATEFSAPQLPSSPTRRVRHTSLDR